MSEKQSNSKTTIVILTVHRSDNSTCRLSAKLVAIIYILLIHLINQNHHSNQCHTRWLCCRVICVFQDWNTTWSVRRLNTSVTTVHTNTRPQYCINCPLSASLVQVSSCIWPYACCMHFVDLHNLQAALCNLATVRVKVRSELGLRLRSGLGQEFANCAV